MQQFVELFFQIILSNFGHQLKAVSTDGDNILTIDLPYQQSTFRLRKYPAPE